jgi:hypothetical protein
MVSFYDDVCNTRLKKHRKNQEVFRIRMQFGSGSRRVKMTHKIEKYTIHGFEEIDDLERDK